MTRCRVRASPFRVQLQVQHPQAPAPPPPEESETQEWGDEMPRKIEIPPPSIHCRYNTLKRLTPIVVLATKAAVRGRMPATQVSACLLGVQEGGVGMLAGLAC